MQLLFKLQTEKMEETKNALLITMKSRITLKLVTLDQTKQFGVSVIKNAREKPSRNTSSGTFTKRAQCDNTGGHEQRWNKERYESDRYAERLFRVKLSR